MDSDRKKDKLSKGALTVLRARLRDERGFMLAEQLVSIIFIGLLSVMVAAGLGAAMSAYASITEQTQADAMLANAVETVSDEFAFALSVEGDASTDKEEGEVVFVSATQRMSAALMSPSMEDSAYGNAGIYMTFVSDDASPVYPIRLVAPENNLIPLIDNVVYYRNDVSGFPAGTWSFRISIYSRDFTRTLAQTTMTVKRIG